MTILRSAIIWNGKTHIFKNNSEELLVVCLRASNNLWGATPIERSSFMLAAAGIKAWSCLEWLTLSNTSSA